MISPERLRRFPFFQGFDDSQLKALAMIAEEHEVEADVTLFYERAAAKKFFMLVEGRVDLFLKSEEENNPSSKREFTVGEINPGEVFGINALLEPYEYGFTERTGTTGRVIEFDGSAIRALMQVDRELSCKLMNQTAKSLMERLYSVRVQLAAAWV